MIKDLEKLLKTSCENPSCKAMSKNKLHTYCDFHDRIRRQIELRKIRKDK